MIIEIDPKKLAATKKRYRWLTILFIPLLISFLILLIPLWILDGVLSSLSAYLTLVTSLLLINLVLFSWVVRRLRRQIRADHRLHLDEVGIASISGHERVDIPWGDIERISYTIGFHAPNARKNQHKNTQMRLTLHLRPDTPYNKRKYRIYNDYEISIHDLAEQVEQLWGAGRDDKMKATIL